LPGCGGCERPGSARRAGDAFLTFVCTFRRLTISLFVKQINGATTTTAFQLFHPHALSPGIVPNAATTRHGSMVAVPPDSPLPRLCRALFRTRGSFLPAPSPVAGFELVRVDAVFNSDVSVAVFEAWQERQRRLRASGGVAFNVETHNFSAAKLQVLLSLMSCLQERKPDADPRSPHTLYVFHGPKIEHLASVCENGIVSLRAMDAGYFGLGCYATLNIEYAAKYARGDYDQEDHAAAPRRLSADGCVAVVMLAASVGMVYPVTPAEDYPAPPRADGHSVWFGQGLKPGFDSHIACVSEPSCEAVNRKECQYVEVVVAQESQLLPVAVLWLREV
jgi:hypothetical protein